MMCFIYTDKAPNLDKMADDLLAAADKVIYQYITNSTAAELIDFDGLRQCYPVPVIKIFRILESAARFY